MIPGRAAAGALALTLVVGACAGGGAASGGRSSPPAARSASPAPASADPLDRESPVTSVTTEPAPVDPGPTRSSLADLVTSVGSTIYDQEALFAGRGPVPLALDIPDLDIVGAAVTPVGVEDNGEMEIPGAREVGWYEHGPTPGSAGSAVLAAHIAYNGRDGVFRRLADLDDGAVLAVVYDDGTRREFVVVERAAYEKEALPFGRVFSREGDPVVTLITCGGDFDRSRSSYEQNVVAYAVPRT